MRFHGDRNRRTNEIETTTTIDEWKPVVVSLEKVGVSQIGKAIAKAQERGDCPNDVQRIIERTQADPLHRGKDLRGIVFNQVCNPSKAEQIRRLRPKPNREVIRGRIFHGMLSAGIPRKDINHDELERMTEQNYQAELARWSDNDSIRKPT